MSTKEKAAGVLDTPEAATQKVESSIVSAREQERKHEATLMAKLAIRGHAVHRIATGGYLVCRHGYVKHCADLEALQAFAWQVGAVK
ncbi:MAG: hypothetical protein U1C47_02290 [Hydrogenophaga sp.]|nr:hypothetical protein [Hydrogenophaga sp.]